MSTNKSDDGMDDLRQAVTKKLASIINVLDEHQLTQLHGVFQVMEKQMRYKNRNEQDKI